jgi:NAD(P)-dependent dehydrogenase (short-subunit alcohol dehydrogenase family)
VGNALAGKVAIVTGANQGLGLAIARRYAEEGASLTLCARDGALLSRAAEEVRGLLQAGADLLVQTADVSKAADCGALVARTLERFGRVDVLVNNAGIYGPKGPIEDVDWDAWVQAIEVNLLGSVLMCRAVLQHFKARRGGKIVQLSGGGATNPLPFISAYAASKAGIVRFIETLAEEARPHGIEANAIAPGALNTRLLDEVLAAGPERVGADFYARALKQRDSGGAPLAAGADLAVFLGSSRSDGVTGKLLSAIWDPWERLGEHLDDLRKSDVYTLRRIVPADRGMSWGETR